MGKTDRIVCLYRSIPSDRPSALQGYTKITQGICLNSLAELEEAFYRPVTINGEPLRRGDLLVLSLLSEPEEDMPECRYIGESRFHPVNIRDEDGETVIRSWEERERDYLVLREGQGPNNAEVRNDDT